MRCAERRGARRKARRAQEGERRRRAAHIRRVGRGRRQGASPRRERDREAPRRGTRGASAPPRQNRRGLAAVTVARLSHAQRVVVKIGSALLTDSKTGKLNRDWLGAFVADVAAMRARGQEMLIVSSGAIALGRRALGLPSGRLKLEESQAAAAVGQIGLAQ